MNTIKMSAKTVDDAVKLALEELQIGRDDAIIKVLDEGSSGLFGLFGKKDAEVEVLRKDEKQFYSDLIFKILGKMDFNVNVNTDNSNGVVYLNIESTEELGGLLIGKNGRTLDALDHLLKRIASNRGFRRDKIVVDVESYRKRHDNRGRSRRYSNRSNRN